MGRISNCRALDIDKRRLFEFVIERGCLDATIQTDAAGLGKVSELVLGSAKVCVQHRPRWQLGSTTRFMQAVLFMYARLDKTLQEEPLMTRCVWERLS